MDKKNKFETSHHINQNEKLVQELYLAFLLQSNAFTELNEQVEYQNKLIQRIKHSISWKITLLLRIAYYLKKKQFRSHVKTRIKQKFSSGCVLYKNCKIKLFEYKLRSYLKFKFFPNFLFHNNYFKNPTVSTSKIDAPSLITYADQFKSIIKKNVNPTSLRIFVNNMILIVAEVTLPQCYKYRVLQKKRYLEALGWVVTIVDWRDEKKAFFALQFCCHVIFYRVPGFQSVLQQIQEAKRLSLNPWWEVDDLIFDKSLYSECGFMDFLSKSEKKLLLSGAELYRKAMLTCEHGIASTRTLSQLMVNAGLKKAYTIENSLDKETLEIIENIKNDDLIRSKKEKKTTIVILYGSGTSTHDTDFLVAAQGIAAVLIKNANVQFWIVGELQLPEMFKKLTNQIKRIPFQSFERYLRLLAYADISIAPLENITFNDGKSNIKYLEASMLEIPSVCSATQTFKDIIKDNVNGFLASSSQEWEDKITLLTQSSSLRRQIGNKAWNTITQIYLPEIICKQQVEPIFGKPIVPKNNPLKVLIVNVYYDPYRFGGATLVASEMAKRFHSHKNVEVVIFTLRPFDEGVPGLRRYSIEGINVFSLPMNSTLSSVENFLNSNVSHAFEEVLKLIQSDIVHFHSIQHLGLQLPVLCQYHAIPYVITLHDAWWLCDRQFMIKPDGKYCFQNEIDLVVCQFCQLGKNYLEARMVLSKEILNNSSLLLSPSDSHRNLYIHNGIDKEKIKVNRNGVIRPKNKRPKRLPSSRLRFGFVAGDERVKGYDLILNVFQSLTQSEWELKIVNNKISMGHASINLMNRQFSGLVSLVPPYNYDSMDKFFYGIDVLLFPSQWKESYGLTVREALLRDVWVICTHPGGQSEDVIDGINGNYISLSGDVSELKNIVEHLLNNVSKFDNYINPYKEQIATLDQQVNELLMYYRQITQPEYSFQP